MRRLAVISLALTALAAPAAALASKQGVNDGVLVVKNASAPKGTPAVMLKNFTGSIIGQTTDQSRIIIDAGVSGPNPEVTGASGAKSVPGFDTAQQWSSPDGFKFRAVGGTFTILIYGSGINLVAIGQGTVTLAGTPDDPTDGWYAINGGDRHSMPGQPVKQLIAGDNS
jgi:hypothetical protein